MNCGILGTVIERITGERFDIYQREHVLKSMNISVGYGFLTRLLQTATLTAA